MIENVILIALEPLFAPTKLIIANQNGPRPVGMYGTVRIDTLNRLPVHVGPQDEDGVRKVSAHRTGQVELQMFGAAAYDTLDLAVQRMTHDEYIERFEEAGIVFGDAHEIQNLPVLRNQSQFEPRAIVEIPFSYTRSTEETLPWIETVEGEATIEGSIASVSITTPFTATIVDNP